MAGAFEKDRQGTQTQFFSHTHTHTHTRRHTHISSEDEDVMNMRWEYSGRLFDDE